MRQRNAWALTREGNDGDDEEDLETRRSSEQRRRGDRPRHRQGIELEDIDRQPRQAETLVDDIVARNGLFQCTSR